VEGKLLHERVHEAEDESRGDVRIARGLRLHSLRLGLVGMADVVEFHRVGGEWQPFPVEYKRGKPKPDDTDRVQLCAQALCLEEMLGRSIPAGALFYGVPRRREAVAFAAALRRLTAETAARLHRLIEAGKTPAAEYGPRCERCSLLHLCLPETAGRGKSAQRYLQAVTAAAVLETAEGK
jgi:CRISPR-associated exonuclease Cas4